MIRSLDGDLVARALAVLLAVLEFVPVAFSSLGFFLLSRLIGRLDRRSGRMAGVAWGLISFGGLAHATWRLMLVSVGVDIAVFATALVVFLAPGLVLFGAGAGRAWLMARAKETSGDPWLIPLGLGWAGLLGAFVLRDSDDATAWQWPLLVLLIFGGLVTSAAVVDLGWRRRLHMAAALVSANSTVALALIAASRVPGCPALLGYLLEVLHAVSEAGFAFAAWRIAVEYQAAPGVRPS